MDRRYVDADWLIADLKLKDHVPLEDEDAWAVIDWLNKFPTIDIVRCKECKYRGEYFSCPIPYRTDDDFFCKEGKRKEVTEHTD